MEVLVHRGGYRNRDPYGSGYVRGSYRVNPAPPEAGRPDRQLVITNRGMGKKLHLSNLVG